MILIKVDLFFDPERRIISNGEKELLLTHNMARCLLVLLNHRGAVVSKEILLKEVWEKNGVIVTDTSIRQTLSQLRKSFISLNINEELIYTIPRQGYKLIQLHEPADESETGALAISPPQVADTEILQVITPPVVRERRRKIYIVLLMFLAAVIFFGLSTFIYFRFYFVTDLNYVRISDNAEREILIPDALHTDKAYISSAMHILDSYIDEKVIKVPVSYQVYINLTKRSDSYSFFICDRAAKLNDCQAVYIQNGLKI